MAPILKSILCVDDEDDILEVVSMSLELLGDFEVHRCGSGCSALEQIAAISPDLVLMDVMMPGLDGPCTMKCIHDMPAFKDLPVVFMTAHVQPEKQRALIDLGAVGCISKPFDPTTISDTLTSIWCGIHSGTSFAATVAQSRA